MRRGALWDRVFGFAARPRRSPFHCGSGKVGPRRLCLWGRAAWWAHGSGPSIASAGPAAQVRSFPTAGCWNNAIPSLRGFNAGLRRQRPARLAPK